MLCCQPLTFQTISGPDFADLFDIQFLFVAATKYCVEIATHRHGCCVLNQCIAHSTGKHREKLIAEVCLNALMLAQDSFG